MTQVGTEAMSALLWYVQAKGESLWHLAPGTGRQQALCGAQPAARQPWWHADQAPREPLCLTCADRCAEQVRQP